MKNKFCVSCVAVFSGVVLSTWLLSSCIETDLKEIKSIPTIEEKRNSFLDNRDFAYHFAYGRGFNNVKIYTPKNLQFLRLDSKYRYVDFFLYKKFNNWFEKLKFENGILPIDQGESHDCDNFAMLYKSLFSISSYKSNDKVEPAVGLVIVDQAKEFGGIPAGGLHALNIVFTTQGWYIFEPQTGEHILLEQYPNQEHIKYIVI